MHSLRKIQKIQRFQVNLTDQATLPLEMSNSSSFFHRRTIHTWTTAPEERSNVAKTAFLKPDYGVEITAGPSRWSEECWYEKEKLKKGFCINPLLHDGSREVTKAGNKRMIRSRWAQSVICVPFCLWRVLSLRGSLYNERTSSGSANHVSRKQWRQLTWRPITSLNFTRICSFIYLIHQSKQNIYIYKEKKKENKRNV